MKKNVFYTIILLICLSAISSCTKVIDLKLGNASGQLVIEGNITNVNGAQSVILSTNVPFSNTNHYPPVSGATVTINDQSGKSYLLTEQTPGTYLANQLSGVAGTTYTLTVKTGSQTYQASSTMPAVVSLDSLTAKNDPVNGTGKLKKVVTVHYKDPAGISNQYRFVLWVNGVEQKDVFANDDQFTNGKYVSFDLMADDVDIYPGDTVKVEMQCIDQPVYKYWFTLQSQQGNGPGGTVAPANPPSNISPVTLGLFSAHTTQSKTFVVK